MVGLFKDEDGRSRSARRVIISVEVMKSTRIALGDLVTLTHSSDGLEEKVPFSLHSGMRRLSRLHLSEILSRHCLAIGGNPKRKFVKLIEQSWEADRWNDTLSAVLISSCLLLTAGLEAGAKIRIFPLTGPGVAPKSFGIPSLRDVPEACSMVLEELSHSGRSSQDVHSRKEPSKRGDWIALLLKEMLGSSLFYFLSEPCD
jgi:hypothetical protein